MSTFQLYRHTTAGRALQDSLDEMLRDGKITPRLAEKVMEQFDRSMCKALATKTESNITMHSEKLEMYKNLDNVWVLLLKNTKFTGDQEIPDVETMKIVACNSAIVP